MFVCMHLFTELRVGTALGNGAFCEVYTIASFLLKAKEKSEVTPINESGACISYEEDDLDDLAIEVERQTLASTHETLVVKRIRKEIIFYGTRC